MIRGPQGRVRTGDERSFIEKAQEAYQADPPDWVMALAERADRDGLKATGAAIGYSGAAVSLAINGKYTGDVDKVAEMTRGALLGAEVDCPILGTMDRKTCLDWQDKPRAQTSSLRARMFRACRGCVHFRSKKEDGNAG